MALDLRPRILVHHVLGDYVMDPFAPGASDLSRYGVLSWEPVLGMPDIPEGGDVTSGLLRAGINTGAIVALAALAFWTWRQRR